MSANNRKASTKNKRIRGIFTQRVGVIVILMIIVSGISASGWIGKGLRTGSKKMANFIEAKAPLSETAGTLYSAMVVAGLLPERPATSAKKAVTKINARFWLASRGYDVDRLVVASYAGKRGLIAEIQRQRQKMYL